MSRSCLPFVFTTGALIATACGGEVIAPWAGDKSGVDPDCYDACVAKGESPETCALYCGNKPGTGGKAGSGAKGGTGGSGAKGGSGGTGGGTGGTLDPDHEKTCIQCWYDETQTGGACAAEAKVCEASLACTQLQWCPILCGKPDCLQECNDIIPTGVAPLTALVQCVACDGGPCAELCRGSVMLAYCE